MDEPRTQPLQAGPLHLTLRPGHPDFRDLPWGIPVDQWQGKTSRLEEVQRGLSRHPVVFVNYSGVLYVIKELPRTSAEREYQMLRKIEDLNLPGVTPVAHGQVYQGSTAPGVLITRFLERSLPYRSLFMRSHLMRYREGLLDSIAGLLVQLHLAGVYWGDCSLSNTLFRRNAGTLQAYLVDAETAEYYPNFFPPTQRLYDLEIMEENVNGDLADLQSNEQLAEGLSYRETGAYIRVRYQRLWEEITREDIINPGETYRIHERIRALNSLGFSVGSVELAETENGNQLRLRIVVSDRTFHRDQLQSLTGIEAEEMQARQMMNEINEQKAILSQQYNRSTPLSVAAYYWLEKIYTPVINRLKAASEAGSDLSELYCQVLEHKWYLSELARHDVGHQAAVEDFLQHFSAAL